MYINDLLTYSPVSKVLGIPKKRKNHQILISWLIFQLLFSQVDQDHIVFSWIADLVRGFKTHEFSFCKAAYLVANVLQKTLYGKLA